MQLDGCDERQEGVTLERKACHSWHVKILPILLKISMCVGISNVFQVIGINYIIFLLSYDTSEYGRSTNNSYLGLITTNCSECDNLEPMAPHS